MLFKDVKIDARVIERAARGWCSDWKPFVLYYLRNKKFVTVQEAYEDFEAEESYISKERECDHCGSTYESEEEEPNPTVGSDEMQTLFKDLGDSMVADWISTCDSADIDWYKQEVTLDWLRNRGWAYADLWSVTMIYNDGNESELGTFADRTAAIAHIEERVRYGYAYRYRITDPEGDTETLDHRPNWKAFRVQPDGTKDGPCSFDTEREAIDYVNDMKPTLVKGQEYHIEGPSGGSYMAAAAPESAPEPERPRATYIQRVAGAVPFGCFHPDCPTTATHSWSDGDIDAPDYLCAEHLPLYTKQEESNVEQA